MKDYTSNVVLGQVLLDLINGRMALVQDIEFQKQVNDYVLSRIANPVGWSEMDCSKIDRILRISNILYNNTSKTVLLLDDGVYDQLLVLYRNYNPNYQVGATPVKFAEMNDEEPMVNGKKLLYHVIKEPAEGMFVEDIHKQHTPLNGVMRPIHLYSLLQEPITKRLINTQHKYPELVGTLDKCKFVLNEDARQAGVFDEPSVQVFERDFLSQCMTMGVIQPGEVFEMCCELKYDGVSVEAEVCNDEIVCALSRGDTGENIATDLTPIFKGYRFINDGMEYVDAKHMIKKPEYNIGIKFEAVITKRNLEILSQLRGKEYKNARNAIIGLLGASDAYRYTDFITLIPIAVSLDAGDDVKATRQAELKYLNTFYNSGEYNRHIFIRGDYTSILYQVKEFVKSAETIRPILSYMIDGVVISFTDPNKIKMLGRVNSVNKWQMAIKFNAKQARSIFMGYTFSMGKSGTIIPMVHFKPVEFIGTIHTKQTIHSFQRFKELCLIKGQEIDITYVNDVLTYINKPLTKHNEELQSQYEPEPFIDHCPYCGSQLELSDSGKSIKCPNTRCHERAIMRMIDAVERLGFKDINEQVVRTLDMTSFSDLFKDYDRNILEMQIGPGTAMKMLDYMKAFRSTPIAEHELMTAMCFEDMGLEKWKRILKEYDAVLLFNMSYDQLRETLGHIKGVGPGTIESVISGFTEYREDLYIALTRLQLIPTKNGQFSKPKAVLTGIRDDALIRAINQAGFDCEESYGMTKDTALLICDSYTSNSGKMQKAKKYGTRVLSVQDFINEYHVTL